MLCKTIAKLFGNIDYFAIVIIPTLIYCIVDTTGELGAYRKLFKTYFLKTVIFCCQRLRFLKFWKLLNLWKRILMWQMHRH